MEPPTTDEARVHIDAPPEQIYALVADITRMGEWSPECYRCEWLDGAGSAAVGARFKGYNRHRIRWTNKPTVIAADPGREFAFTRTGPGAGKVTWRYRMTPNGGGTHLVESYEVVTPPAAVMGAMTGLMTGIKDRKAY